MAGVDIPRGLYFLAEKVIADPARFKRSQSKNLLSDFLASKS